MIWFRGKLNSRVIWITLCIGGGIAYSVLLFNFHLYLFTKDNDAGSIKLSSGIDAGKNPVPPTSFNEDFHDRVIAAQPSWKLGLMNGVQIKSEPKKILLIDTFRWWNYNRTQLSESCPGIHQKCQFIEPSFGLLNISSELGEVDAVVVARDYFHRKAIPVPNNVAQIYFTLESPLHARFSLTRGNDLLATYWRGADIVIPYGKWVYYNQSIRTQTEGRNYASGRSGLAAIFISNCRSSNDRLEYVLELQKFIPVDIYGKCGSFRCPKSQRSECFARLKRHYKFYLAFENSNCRDYITEKIFENAYENDVLPIVMGAHPDDYKALLPLHSYIHVEDFENPEALANYLKYLDIHDDEYNKYFEWKGTGKFFKPEVLCQICAKLNLEDDVANKAVSPTSLDVKMSNVFHWNEGNSDLCLPSYRMYWNYEDDDRSNT